jgi:hypothetical protein
VTAIVYGALFGFFTHATRDLLNYATLRNWSNDDRYGMGLSSISGGGGGWVLGCDQSAGVA